MIYGKSAETIARKDTGGRDYLRTLRLSHQARRLLYRASLAGSGNSCYDNNSWCYYIPALETETRFQLVRKGGRDV